MDIKLVSIHRKSLSQIQQNNLSGHIICPQAFHPSSIPRRLRLWCWKKWIMLPHRPLLASLLLLSPFKRSHPTPGNLHRELRPCCSCSLGMESSKKLSLLQRWSITVRGGPKISTTPLPQQCHSGTRGACFVHLTLSSRLWTCCHWCGRATSCWAPSPNQQHWCGGATKVVVSPWPLWAWVPHEDFWRTGWWRSSKPQRGVEVQAWGAGEMPAQAMWMITASKPAYSWML